MGFIGAPLGYIMYWIIQVITNYGWALIVFTILIKLVLFPLSIKQQKNTAKMASFQPKLKQLQAKYGKDKQKYQEETMKLYEQEGYNPMSGCLPMLAQFIVLFGIIDVVYKPLVHMLRIPADIIAKADVVIRELAANLGSSSQLAAINIIQDGQPTETFNKLVEIFSPAQIESIKNLDMNFLGMNLGQTPTFAFNILILIPILAGATAFITSYISTKQQEKMGQTMNTTMKVTFYLMPLMSVYFGFTLPAGVGIYWIISNVTAIAQSLILAKIYTPERMAKYGQKESAKSREKMIKKRERVEELKKIQAARQNPNGALLKDENVEAKDDTQAKKTGKELLDEKQNQESAQDRIKEARRKIAEKYGEEYKE